MLTKLLRNHLRPYRAVITGIIVLTVAHTAATLTLPTLNAQIIDKGVLQGDNGYIWRMGLIMLAFTLGQIAFQIGATYYSARTAMGFGRDVRNSIFHQVTAFSAREVSVLGAPSLITRITNDVQQIQMVVVMAMTMLFQAPITMVVGIIMALREDVGLSLVLAFSIPGGVIVLGSIVYRMVPYFQAMQERLDGVNRVMREQIDGIRVVRAFVREPEEEARFARANEELTAVSLGAGRLMALMFPTIILLVNVSSVGVLWIGADRIDDGSLQLGSLVAYLTYLLQILMAVVMATFMVSMIPRAAVAAERIQEVLDTEPSVVPPADPVRQVPTRGTIEFRDVSFRFPGAEHPVLGDVSFRAGPGQTTAVIGSTGSGKTTLVNLAARLVDASEGAVLIDDVDVRQLDPGVLWEIIGLVPQRPFLFSGTIRSNLRYGKPDADEEEMWEALRVAQAEDFVRAMPGGLDARIEQGGTNVSGGQRQRLSIARALVRRPEVYLFDDSFSALDMATDARLRTALRPFTADAASIVIAQRVTSIMDADEILVLEDGELVGRGTHADLVDSCPTYAEIVSSQLGERGHEVTHAGQVVAAQAVTTHDNVTQAVTQNETIQDGAP